MNSSSKLAYVNNDGKLKYAYKGIVSELSESADAVSLTDVYGDDGFSYMNGDNIYYVSKDCSETVLLSENGNVSYPGVVYFKGNIYYYDKDEIVNFVKDNGKNNKSLRNAERIWIG